MEAEHEAKRGLELRISNAQFSKLIKMGRDKGMTPQRVGQALFDEAYEAACMGKGRAAAEPAGDQAELDDLRGRLKEAEQYRDFYKSEMTECRAAQQREANDMDDLQARLRTAKAERDQARAEAEQLRQRLAEECGALPTALIDQAAIDAASLRPGPIVFVSNPPSADSVSELYKRVVPDSKSVAIEPALAPGEEHPKIFGYP